MIKGKTLRDAIISGANNIANSRQEVDALNVFPVPDGDTGTNMSMTIAAAKRELELLSDDTTVEEVSKVAASALLRGARGNSGVILSLLFRGFSKGLVGKKTASPADIAGALTIGVEAAYKAVMKPTEGTILTVSRVAAEEAVRAAATDISNGQLFEKIVSAAGDILQKTPDMLPVLKKAGVVDAGGKGFLVVLEGMSSVINNGVIIPVAAAVAQVQTANQPAVTTFFENAEDLEFEITFTYCTEFIINKSETDKSPLTLRAYLETIGDCVVVVDDEDIIKIHVHTDNPGKALQKGITFGMLSNIKIENMREQFANELAKSKKAEENKTVFGYVPVDPNIEYGFVAVAAGVGLQQLFVDLGVANIVSGGQTMNPSTDEILNAIHATPAKTVFVLPNNKNIIMAAEQAIKLADRTVMVLQTKTIPQGISAVLAFDDSSDSEENFIEMSHASEGVATGMITFAARDSDFDDHNIKKDEILALENGKLSFVDKDIVKATVKLTKNMIKKNSSASFVTIIQGEDSSTEQSERILELLNAKYGDDIEFAIVNGSQPVYYFIISVE